MNYSIYSGRHGIRAVASLKKKKNNNTKPQNAISEFTLHPITTVSPDAEGQSGCTCPSNFLYYHLVNRGSTPRLTAGRVKG